MTTQLTVTGAGTVGVIEPGWSVTEQATPVAIGESSGTVGSASVSAARTGASEFVGRSAVSIVHPDLGTWAGTVGKVTLPDALTAQLETVGISQPLVATVTAKPFMSGTPIHSWSMPGLLTYRFAFDSTGNMYAYNYRIPQITAWRPTGEYIGLVAANGGGNGQAGASLVAAGNGIVVDPTDTYLYFCRSTAATNWIHKVTLAGVYVTSFATSGSADGQLAQSSAIAVLSNGNLVVADGGNNRVQILSPTGTFVAKWGTLGAGTGQFTALYDVTVDASDNIYTSEGGGRVQKFTSAGAYVSSFNAGASITGLAVNGDGSSAYLLRSVPRSIETWTGGVQVASWPTGPASSQIRYLDGNVSHVGIDYIGRESAVTRIRGLSTLEDALTYLAVLYDPTILSINYLATTNPTVTLPGWTGDIWSRVRDLCSAYGVTWSVVDGVFTVRDVGSSTLTIDANTPVAMQAASQGGSRSLAIKYQNTQSGTGLTMFTATAIQTLQILETRSATFQTTAHPLSLNVPTPTDSAGATPGTYHVQDSAGLDVPAALWTYYGGAVTPALGDVPGQIRITFQGPRGIIPGYTAPFSFATGTGNGRTPQLIITGTGVTVDPDTVVVGTGADPDQAATTVGATIDNFAIATPAQAYSRGSWAQTLATGTDTIITFDMYVDRLAGFGLDVGSIIPFNFSFYRITDVTYGDLVASVTAHRHVDIGDVKTAFGNTLVATNYSWNPSFETNVTGYAERSNPGNTYTGTWSATQAHQGTRSLLITATGGINGGGVVFDINPPVQRVAGETIELSYWVYPNATKLIRPRIYTYTTDNGTGTATSSDGVDVSCTLNTWTKLTLSTTLAAGVRSYVPTVRTDGFSTGGGFTTMYIDEVMNGNVGQTFFTGSTTAGGELYVWNGPTNNSTSRRYTGTWTNGMVKALWAGYTNADVKIKPLRTS